MNQYGGTLTITILTNLLHDHRFLEYHGYFCPAKVLLVFQSVLYYDLYNLFHIVVFPCMVTSAFYNIVPRFLQRQALQYYGVMLKYHIFGGIIRSGPLHHFLSKEHSRRDRLSVQFIRSFVITRFICFTKCRSL